MYLGGTSGMNRRIRQQSKRDWKCPSCKALIRYFWTKCPNCAHPRPEE